MLFGDDPFNHSRMPLQKGMTRDSVTDYSVNTNVPVRPAIVQGDYRVPVGRTLGNVVFRRDVNGQLDIDYAKNLIVDCIHKQKDDESQLTDLERLLLSITYPTVFNYVDAVVAAKMRIIQFHLQDFEVQKICMAVADHLLEEMHYASTPKP